MSFTFSENAGLRISEKNEIIQILHSVALRHGDDFVLVEGGEDGGYRRFWDRFGTRQSMTFGRWRQQLRLMQGMRLLAEGAKVTHAALESGYGTASAFTSMFRKALGITPSSYFR